MGDLGLNLGVILGRISASFYFQAFFNLDSVGIGWYGVFLSASSLVTQFGTRQTIPSWKLWLIDLSALLLS